MNDGYQKQLAGLLRYVRPHQKILAVSFCLSMVSTAMGLVQPLFAKFLIDKVLLGRQFEWLLPLVALVIALLVFGFLVRSANSYLYTRYSAQVLFKMREDLFDHLHRVPLNLLSKKKIGDVYSRLGSDMADIQALVTETLPGLAFNFLTVVFTGIFLLWLNWQMALLSLCGLPPALLLIRRLRPKVVAVSRRIAEKNADLAHFLFESLAGTSVIRSFGAEKLELEKLAEQHAGLLRFILRSRVLGAVSGAVPVLFTILNMLVIYGYGGYAVKNGTLTIGGLVAFAFYQGRVFGPLQGLMDGFLAFQSCRVALSRVQELWQVQPAFQDPCGVVIDRQQAGGVLAFDNVFFAYSPEAPLFRGLSFQIPARQVTAIVGPSGVGKTTLCHLMTRLFDPDSGQIALDGIDIRRIDMNCLRHRIALVSQETFLFHTSILENLKFGKPSATLPEITCAAEAAGIHEFIQNLPNGYHTVVGDRGVRLSGGQKQRISIARSLLMDPAILILDEPTAFLDPTCEERLQQTFHELIKGKTIILVSHRVSTIRQAQWIVALNQSEVVYAGPLSGFRAEHVEPGFMVGEDAPPIPAACRMPLNF